MVRKVNGSGHSVSAIGTGGILYASSTVFGFSPWMPLVGILMGVKAPDYLELPISHTIRLIPHRTITHWLSLWILLLAFSLHGMIFGNQLTYLANSFFMGYALGGLTHCFCDAGTRMGIPVINPFRRRSFYLLRNPFTQWAFLSLFTLLGYFCWKLTL